MNTGRARHRRLAPVLAVLLVPVLTGLAGCAAGGSPAPSSSASQTATGSSTAGATAITIKDFGYGAPVTVAPGATVTVANLDSAPHTVTADDGSAFDANVKGSGATTTFTSPSQTGTYTFHCTYHPNMRGTLTVK
ncbi:cupredoxin domain-containing protein [Arthrobacter sp. CG_A4]|uniref:cupredoxin domain-containing protein n=1 Tax=Arthrobacter sp. CG_A4 TaxID=3071706 RepID=UPI002E08CF46|nr:plastocyanin [Arthrobacter sp. CG_A4]